MHTYVAHRQRIESEWVLPEGILPTSAGPIDLCFASGELDFPDVRPVDQAYWEFEEQRHDFYWSDLGRVRVHASGEVTVHPYDDAPQGLLQHVLLGPIIADWLMWRKKRLALHANCLTRPGGALAIVGTSGAGKSTLAGALSTVGAFPHGDDVIGVDPETGLVPFGTCRTKLNPDVLSTLGLDSQDFPPVFETMAKRSVVLAQVVDRQVPPDQPLKVIYCLTDSEEDLPRFEPVSPIAAPVKIFRDVFRLEAMQHSVGLQTIFSYCGKVAEKTAVILLHRKKDLGQLQQLAIQVRDHFDEFTGT